MPPSISSAVAIPSNRSAIVPLRSTKKIHGSLGRRHSVTASARTWLRGILVDLDVVEIDRPRRTSAARRAARQAGAHRSGSNSTPATRTARRSACRSPAARPGWLREARTAAPPCTARKGSFTSRTVSVFERIAGLPIVGALPVALTSNGDRITCPLTVALHSRLDAPAARRVELDRRRVDALRLLVDPAERRRRLRRASSPAGPRPGRSRTSPARRRSADSPRRRCRPRTDSARPPAPRSPG